MTVTRQLGGRVGLVSESFFGVYGFGQRELRRRRQLRREQRLEVVALAMRISLDEALLACAAGRPTFALQDYPGDASAIAS